MNFLYISSNFIDNSESKLSLLFINWFKFFVSSNKNWIRYVLSKIVVNSTEKRFPFFSKNLINNSKLKIFGFISENIFLISWEFSFLWNSSTINFNIDKLVLTK